MPGSVQREPGRPSRATREWWILTLALVALAIGLSLGPQGTVVGQLARVDTMLFDAFNRLSPRAPPDEIAIIAIDEDSIAQIGRWPWPRSVHAALLDRLAAAGVRAVGLDILFSEADLSDRVLAAAIERGPPVVLPVGSYEAADGRSWPLLPVPGLSHGKARLGHAQLRIDSDGVVRGLYLDAGGLPAFSLALLQAASTGPLPARAQRALADTGNGPHHGAPQAGRWSARNPMLLPASSAVASRWSYAQVLRGEVPDAALRGRIVLVGATAEGLGDVYAQRAIAGPALRPGVDLHASALATLMQDRWLVRASPAAQAALAAALVFATMLLLYRAGPRYGLLVVAFALLGTAAISAVVLALAGLWLPSAGTLAAVALAYPLWSWRRMEAAMAGLIVQARALRDEPDLLPTPPERELPVEPVARELQALDGAAERIRMLRRLLFTVIDRLPNPAIVTTGKGVVVLSNRVARTAFSSVPIEQQSIDPWLRSEFEGHPELQALPPPDGGPLHAIEARDRSGRSWLVDIDRARERSLPLIWLLQFTDISPIREVQRAREEMMRFLSHDMRSPSVSVLSLIESARARGEDSPTMGAIESLTRDALDLAEGFVQWARAENVPIGRDRVDLLSTMTEAADANWALARRHHATIRVRADGIGEATIRGDAQLVRRAIGNLIENALKYGADHGIVDLRLSRRGRQWRITVADSGPGLGVSDPATLFDPYVRGRNTEGRSGSGLGLALVRVVAERHGGSAFARDCAPTGAEFHLEFPAAI